MCYMASRDLLSPPQWLFLAHTESISHLKTGGDWVLLWSLVVTPNRILYTKSSTFCCRDWHFSIFQVGGRPRSAPILKRPWGRQLSKSKPTGYILNIGQQWIIGSVKQLIVSPYICRSGRAQANWVWHLITECILALCGFIHTTWIG